MSSYISKRFISTLAWSKKLFKPYANNPERKSDIEQKVVDHAKNSGVDARGAKSAIIVSTAHTGGTNPGARLHVTVEYKAANGSHITTKHVDV